MPSIESPLVGRDRALADLDASLGATAGGVGGCLVVGGPAGIGKSRLLEAAAARAFKLSMAVAAGQATELDRVSPLISLLSALNHCEPLRLGLPGLDDGDGTRFSLIDRIGEAIEDYVRERALLVVVDDAQWADELSALALRVLVPALSTSPILWLLGRRAVPLRSPGQDTIDQLIAEDARQLRLGPLTDAAVTELCAHVLGARPDATVLALAARSGGNPFLLEQVFAALRDAGQVHVSDGTASLVGDELPFSFLAAVDRRVRALSPDARRLLEVGSVLNRPFSVHAAAHLMGRSAAELVPATNEVVDGGTLVDRGSNLAFRHDLLREAIYNNLSGPVRSVLHREAAIVVRADGGSPVEIAEHLIRSDHKGDSEAIAALRDAAAHVAGNAPSTAADLILHALDMLDGRDPLRAEVVADAVQLLASAGRLVEASELGETALRIGLDAPAEAGLLLGLAEALKHAGQNAAVVDYTARALARVGVPEPVRAELLAIRAHALLYVDEMDEADRVGAEAAVCGAAVGEHPASVFGLVARSVVARARGNLDDAVDLARQAVDIADAAGGEARHRHPRLWLACGLATLDRFSEADAIYAAGHREADQLGTAWSQPLWHFYRASLLVWAGQLDEAHAEADAGIRISERLTALQLGVPLLALMAQVAIYRGELSIARQHIEKSEQLLARGITVASEDLTWNLALFQDATGDPRAAVETLDDLYSNLPSRLLLLANDPGAAARLVRIAQRAGALPQAEAAAAAIRGLAGMNPAVASLAGAAAHAEGLLRADPEKLRQAVAHYRSSPRLLARASAIEDAAVVGQSGRCRDAVPLLEEALRYYVDSRAVRDVARVEKRLRGLGVRRRLTGARTGRGSPWSTLTQSELRVVRLVAEGMTNREVANQLYLSPHTVDSHLRHVFTKLDINGRVELTRAFMKQGIVPQSVS
jgi:DNA-binding CsgD family transcriptional regulator/tetratricopeptide (TPR) repeat protein